MELRKKTFRNSGRLSLGEGKNLKVFPFPTETAIGLEEWTFSISSQEKEGQWFSQTVAL